MPKYKPGDEKKYFPIMFAALLVLAAAVSFFVASFVKGDPDKLEEILIEEVDGVTHLDPGPGMATPTSGPDIPPPTEPPPSN